MIQNQEFTYIGKTTVLSGTFQFNGPTHLQGQIRGEITVLSNARLVLEINSITEATLNCNDLDIYGHFTGEIHSNGKVTVYPTAVIEGKIISKSLEILPGAVINMIGHTKDN